MNKINWWVALCGVALTSSASFAGVRIVEHPLGFMLVMAGGMLLGISTRVRP